MLTPLVLSTCLLLQAAIPPTIPDTTPITEEATQTPDELDLQLEKDQLRKECKEGLITSCSNLAALGELSPRGRRLRAIGPLMVMGGGLILLKGVTGLINLNNHDCSSGAGPGDVTGLVCVLSAIGNTFALMVGTGLTVGGTVLLAVGHRKGRVTEGATVFSEPENSEYHLSIGFSF